MMAAPITRSKSISRPKFWQRLRTDANWKWLTPGIGVKRWIVLFLFGVTLISLGLAFVLVDVYRNTESTSATYYLTLQFLPRLERALIVGTIGIAALSIAAYKLSRSILAPFTRPGGKPVAQALVEHRQRERGPKVVAIGGGTGLSTLVARAEALHLEHHRHRHRGRRRRIQRALAARAGRAAPRRFSQLPGGPGR